jgi:hypothetical protein
MFLLRGSVGALTRQAAAGGLVPHLADQFWFVFGARPSRSEVRSWERSIPALLNQLTDAGLHEVEVLVEYRLPLSSKRADVVLVGQHPRGDPSCVVVENKQWSRLELVDSEHRLVGLADSGGQEHLHPQEQVRRYVEYLQDFNRYLGEHPGSAAGCVYLHNATSGNIGGLRHPDLADLSFYPAFAADEVAKMRSFLTHRLAPVPGAQFADDFLASATAPSKQLLKLVPQEITANPQFVLLDEQHVAYEVVLRAVEHARRSDAKEAVIITGGPGVRQERDRGGFAGRAGQTGLQRLARYGQQVVHDHAAAGGGPPGTARARALPLHQCVHGRRAQRPGRADRR